MGQIPLGNIFAALVRLGYRETAWRGPFVMYDKPEPDVAPSPAIFDTMLGYLTEEDIREILGAAGIDRDAFFAELESL